ncbi:MAG: nicotinamidase [Nitrospinae bacterium]|nr:nicotinamidase [Nitrospinota bacterium]
MAEYSPGAQDGLIVVDLQVDFCPGGALAVSEGDKIVSPVNRLLEISGWTKVATRDWHPADHTSFQAQGGIWPVHCVADTRGAAFHPQMKSGNVEMVVSKATTRDAEAYSGFDGTALADDLRASGIERLFVCGLATDYCVKATALDARREGFEVVVVEDAIRAVNVEPKDGETAIEEMRAAGCAFALSSEIRSN